MAPVLASGQKPQTNFKGRAFGLEQGSAAADCFSRAAPQVGRNTSISPFTFPLWGFHRDVCDVLSLGIEMPSSGCQFWGWCPSCKNSGAAAARDVSETPLFQLWSWCPYWGWPRDAPPHPFKVKLGDHFSAAPEITPGWGVDPWMWNTRDTPPLPERIDCVDQASTTNSDTMPLSTVSRPRPLCKSRRRTLHDTADAREQTLWPSTQTLAAVLLLLGWSQRLKKTETPQKKPPKVHGLGPTNSGKSQR